MSDDIWTDLKIVAALPSFIRHISTRAKSTGGDDTAFTIDIPPGRVGFFNSTLSRLPFNPEAGSRPVILQVHAGNMFFGYTRLGFTRTVAKRASEGNGMPA